MSFRLIKCAQIAVYSRDKSFRRARVVWKNTIHHTHTPLIYLFVNCKSKAIFSQVKHESVYPDPRPEYLLASSAVITYFAKFCDFLLLFLSHLKLLSEFGIELHMFLGKWIGSVWSLRIDENEKDKGNYISFIFPSNAKLHGVRLLHSKYSPISSRRCCWIVVELFIYFII